MIDKYCKTNCPNLLFDEKLTFPSQYKCKYHIEEIKNKKGKVLIFDKKSGISKNNRF